MLHHLNTTSYKQALLNKKREDRITGVKHTIIKTLQYINNGLSSINCYAIVLR